MGWKSTVDITRSEALRLIIAVLTDVNDMSDSELEDLLYTLGYGDKPELEYYGHNFHVTQGESTGYYDVNRNEIFVGDTLESEWGYDVIVKKDDEGNYYGQLVCDDDHSCKDIAYALNEGKGYNKLF